MTGYVARRVAALLPVLVGVSLLAFALSTLTPGDPARLILERRTGDPPTTQEVEALREELGLDAAPPVRYTRWLRSTLTGDLGRSFQTGQPVLGELTGRFVVTLQLALPALLIALLIALPVGIVSAVFRGSAVDHASRIGALFGASVPSFWLAYVLIIVFAVWAQLLPVAGRGSWRHLVLPAMTLGVVGSAGLMRIVRSSVLDVIGEDYIRTARAKGLPERRVIGRHAFRNAMVPVVTLTGLRFGHLLAGAVIVETVFAWPGIGTHVVAAIYARDYPTIQGFVLLTGTVFVIVNLLVDLSYGWLDPRIRVAAAVDSRG